MLDTLGNFLPLKIESVTLNPQRSDGVLLVALNGVLARRHLTCKLRSQFGCSQRFC